MRMNGRRESGNIDDRRGQGSSGFGGSGGGLNNLALLFSLFSLFRKSKGSNGSNQKGGCGCLGIIVVLVIGFLVIKMMGSGGLDLGSVLNSGLVSSGSQSAYTETEYQPSEEEEALATFAKQVFAGTEDVWTEIFAQNGLTYECPRLVLYNDRTSSGCGAANSSTGPFYCSADKSVYIDLSFFMNMKRNIGADGDFAYAYVIAHEVGHHVQYLLGTLSQVHKRQTQVSEKESNQLSVRLELQADFFAGVWAYHDNKMFNSLEDGDIEEAIAAAQKIGDDYLQKQARGYTVPDSFNHGTSAQRSKWLKKGIQTGNPELGNTFDIEYSKL